MRLQRASLLAATVLFLFSLVAHADNVKSFTLDATFSNAIFTADANGNLVEGTTTAPISVAGTISVDTTTGVFTGGNVTVNSDGTIFVFDTAEAVVYRVSAGNNPNEIEFYNSFVTPTAAVGFSIPGSLVDYTGGPLCSGTNQSGECTDQFGGTYSSIFEDVATTTPFIREIGVGSLDASTAPEPSSLALLATGLLSVGGVVRKRLARS